MRLFGRTARVALPRYRERSEAFQRPPQARMSPVEAAIRWRSAKRSNAARLDGFAEGNAKRFPELAMTEAEAFSLKTYDTGYIEA